MKIALIHYQYGPGGGMDAHFADLVRGFSERGDSVDIWTYEKSEDFPLPPNVHLRLVKLNYPFKGYKKIAFHTQIVRDLDPSQYDLVLGTMRTAKQDINVNGGTHIGFAGNVNKRFRINDVLPIFFERRTLRGSKKIVAHSRMIAEEIKRYYKIPTSKIHVLHPPANEARFNLEHRMRRTELQQKHGMNGGKFNVLFPSTNHKIKGLGPLLEAFARLPSDRFELLIAGVPMEGQPTPANVRFLGYVKEMEELYAACDLTVLPSHYDGFGLVVIESLACGTPVITSNHAGASDLVDHAHGLVLDEISPEKIEKTILEASSREFRIDPDFLKNRGLTVSQHIEAIRSLAAQL